MLREKMNTISGCITAMITPFNKKLQVDYNGLRELVKFQIGSGISGLAPLGTTGEAPTIDDEERKGIIETVVDEAEGKVPVIVGTGSNSTEKTVKYTKEAERLGAEAALVVTPYYNRPSQEGIYHHFKALSEATRLPIIVYNIPSRTGVNIETETMVRIAKLDNVMGVKESSKNMQQMMDVINSMPNGFSVLSGDDNYTLPLIALGGHGAISVVSNLLPSRVSEMVRNALSGNMELARKLHYELMPIFKGAFIEPNPAPIKAAMNIAGMPAGSVRAPLCSMEAKNIERLKSAIGRYSELRSYKKAPTRQ